MNDIKEKLINTIVLQMNLPDKDSKRLKNLMYINLNDYSITEITDTDIVVRDESLNEEAVRMFFIAKNIQGCTKKTIGYYGLTIKAFLEFMGNKPVNQITTNDIRYYLAVKKERDGNKDTNINNIRRVLSSFFGWLLEEEYIQKNPMAKIKTIKVEKRLKKPFKDEEIEKMRFAAKDNLRLSAILEVLLSTGCRVAEVEGMNREDLEGNEIVVYGKGKKERTVYLNAKCKMALERYLKSRQDDNPAMFVTQDKPHGRLKISGIEISIRNLGKSVGVKDTHPHRFRRTAATTALNRGMPIEQVQLMLGHENIETTTLYAISDVEQVKANHKKYMA